MIGELLTLDICDILRSPNIQIRESMNPDLTRKYADHILAGGV